MKPTGPTLFFSVIILSLLLAACGTGDGQVETDSTTVVAQTTTATARESPPLTSTVASTGDYQPIGEQECSDLNTTLSQQIGLPGAISSPEPFKDPNNDKTGFGCKISLITDGADTNHDRLEETVPSSLEADGWVEDGEYTFPGVGKLESAYRKGDQLCLTVSYVEPWEDTLCAKTEDFVTCLDRLPPEQIRYGFNLNCARPVP